MRADKVRNVCAEYKAYGPRTNQNAEYKAYRPRTNQNAAYKAYEPSKKKPLRQSSAVLIPPYLHLSDAERGL